MTYSQHIQTITQDAVIWLGIKHWKQAKTPTTEQLATEAIVKLITAIPSTIKRDSYVSNMSGSIAELNLKTNSFISRKEKELKDLDKKLQKASDKDRHDLLATIKQLEQEIKTYEAQLLPTLSMKDLAKYVKAELEQKDKEKKKKQSTIFGNNGDHDPDATFNEDEGDPWLKCPKWMNPEKVKADGFSLVDSQSKYGYYSYDPNNKNSIQISNFSIKPIFHIVAENPKDSRHLIEVDNGKRVTILDVESKAMISIDIMQVYLVGSGNYIIHGSKPQYLRIATKLMDSFRSCFEVKILGWQRYGFYAFVNKCFIPGKGLVDYDKWGVVEMEEKNFFTPPASSIYKKTISTEDDRYLMDRCFAVMESPVTFSEWVAKMQRVYPDHKADVGIAYCILSAFRDFISTIDNNFPHLYAYGSTSSGKSKWAESLHSLFYVNRPFFQLNSGTDNALFLYGGRFMNGLAGFNEFDINSIDMKRYQQIKGWYDLEGRQRGVMGGNKRQTESVDITSGVVLIGQFLVTADDNSIVNRSIIEPFFNRNLTNDDKREFEELKSLEKKGITSILLEVLEHREFFKEHFAKATNRTLRDWRTRYGSGGNFNQRVMQNWSYVFNAIDLIKQKINISIDVEEFNNYCFNKASYWCEFLRTTDALSEFWNTILFLSEAKQISDLWDYRIETKSEITLRKGDETYTKAFTEPTKVLYLRLNNVHKLYQISYRNRTSKEGMSMESILHYLSNRDYYLGAVKNYRFKRKVAHSTQHEEKVTNAYAFVYDELGIELEMMSENQDELMNKFEQLVKDQDFDEKPFG